MDASVEERLERFATALEERLTRFRLMLDAVIERLEEATEDTEAPESQMWTDYVHQLTEAAERLSPAVEQEWLEMEALVKSGYRRTLMERHLRGQDVRIPESKDEFDRLPDALTELRKRRSELRARRL